MSDTEAHDTVDQDPRDASNAFQVVVEGESYSNWWLLQLEPDGTVLRGSGGESYSAEVLRLR